LAIDFHSSITNVSPDLGYILKRGSTILRGKWNEASTTDWEQTASQKQIKALDLSEVISQLCGELN